MARKIAAEIIFYEGKRNIWRIFRWRFLMVFRAFKINEIL